MARFFGPILFGAQFARASMGYSFFIFSKESKKKWDIWDKRRKPLKKRDKVVPKRFFVLGQTGTKRASR
jgi:hypothetical protein